MRQKGFALFEIVVALGLFALFVAVSAPTAIKLFIQKREKATQLLLDKTAAVLRLYYDRYSVAPASLDSLQGWSDEQVVYDSWGRRLYYGTNVVYGGKKYDCLVLSKGADGVQNSVIDSSGNFYPSGDDLWRLISLEDLRSAKEVETLSEIEDLRKRILEYYRRSGSAPDSLSDVADSSLLSDAFSVNYSYYKNVTYQSKVYGALVISAGKNRQFDSVVSLDGTFSPSGDDLYTLIDTEAAESSKKITLERIDRANGARSVCLSVVSDPDYQGPSYDCDSPIDLVVGDFLDGESSYDYWGTLLYWSSEDGSFKSAGPDKQQATDDDF